MRKAPSTVSYIIMSFFIILFLAVVINLAPSETTSTSSYNMPQETVPTISIHLQNSTLEELTSSQKTKFNVSTLETTTDETTTTYNTLKIKGHGNSTWKQQKKSFQINFNHNVKLLNFRESKKWVLLANYFDASHLKNATGFYLEKLLNQDFALNGIFINLLINGEALGLYYLSEKVELGENRINLSNPQGILVEYEGLHAHLEDNTCYKIADAECLAIKEVVKNSFQESAANDFVIKYEKLYSAAKEQDYEMASSIADLDSFAKYYLLSEITLNPDSYLSSYYFYQNGIEDKIHIGPGWDFDLSFGFRPIQGTNYGINFFSPYKTGVHNLFSNEKLPLVQDYDQLSTFHESESSLMYYLIRIPEFHEKVKNLYNKCIYNQKPSILSFIDNQASLIKEYAEKDNTKWGHKDFAESTKELRDWLSDRLDYLDYYYHDNSVL